MVENGNIKRCKTKVVKNTNYFLFFFSCRFSSADLLYLLSYYKLLLLCEHIKMSRSPDAKEDPVECPLCMEPLEIDDINFFPCTCGYQICRFCWHRIRTDENGLCPACRKVNILEQRLALHMSQGSCVVLVPKTSFSFGETFF